MKGFLIKKLNYFLIFLLFGFVVYILYCIAHLPCYISYKDLKSPEYMCINSESPFNYKMQCIAKKTAFIIPYRDRPLHLKQLIYTLKKFFLLKGKDYDVFVVEQLDNNEFNKGKLMNIAFDYIMNISKINAIYDCIIFHDVDLLIQIDKLSGKQFDFIYNCSKNSPLHVSSSIDEMKYNLMYPTLVGGILAFTIDQYLKTNGFSNLYLGWGAEDDDMSMRIKDAGMNITHVPLKFGKFNMLKHRKRKKSKYKNKLLKYWTRWRYDGLNSIKNSSLLLNYPKFHELLPLFRRTSLLELRKRNSHSGHNGLSTTITPRDILRFKDQYWVGVNRTNIDYVNISVIFEM